MSNGELFVKRLLRAVPELNAVYDESLEDNDMLLPHVFMGDVTRFIAAEAGRTSGTSILQRFLRHLENELSAGDAEAIELIRASFIENLIGEKAVVNKLMPLMEPSLLREVEAIHGN